MEILEVGQSSGHLAKSIVTDGLIVNFATYEDESRSIGLHYHVNPHFSYLFKGKDLEVKNKTEYRRQAGEMFFYHAGEPHQTTCTKEPTQAVIFEITQNFVRRFNLNEALIGVNVNKEQINILVANILKSIDLGAEDDEIHFSVLDLINYKADHINDVQPDWTKEVRNHLHDHWNGNINLEELSRITGLHTVTISKNFKRYFNCNLAEYRRRIKVEKAISLLKGSKYSLTEIAYDCGFSDQSHFIRVFTDVTRFLPSEYRNFKLQ